MTQATQRLVSMKSLLEAVQGRMRALGIQHVTVQVEREPTCD